MTFLKCGDRNQIYVYKAPRIVTRKAFFSFRCIMSEYIGKYIVNFSVPKNFDFGYCNPLLVETCFTPFRVRQRNCYKFAGAIRTSIYFVASPATRTYMQK